jgi:hypothetical protein
LWKRLARTWRAVQTLTGPYAIIGGAGNDVITGEPRHVALVEIDRLDHERAGPARLVA